MTAHHLRTSAPIVALALMLTGCAGTDATSAPASTSASGSASTSASTSGDSSAAPSSPAGQRIEVSVTGGQASGDTGRVPVALGESITLVVTSDAADEVHVHGYDREAALVPGSPTEIAFDATVPGVFEVELHEAGTVLLTLQVG